MQLSIPFHKSILPNDCGPQSLRMVCEHLGEKITVEKSREIVQSLASGMVWTLGMARGASKLGFITEVISSNDDDLNNEFYDKYADDEAMQILTTLKKECNELNVKMTNKNPTIIDLLLYIDKGIAPIALINWNIIAGKEGFFGHFVVITGYDQDHIYIHNPGIENAQEYMPIDKRLFMQAYKSKGTDNNLVLIIKK